MKVTRDVILDLLPLHQAGEASDDTRDLIAAFAAQDPEIERLLASPPTVELPDIPQPLAKETEMHTLEKTRTTLKLQTVLLSGALLLTLLAALSGGLLVLLIGKGGGEMLLAILLTWGPVMAGVSGLMMFIAWAAYLAFRHYHSA